MVVVCAQVYVLTRCQYFISGMEYLFSNENIRLSYVKSVSDISLSDDEKLMILLVLDMSGYDSLVRFREAVDYVMQINHPRKVGILVSRYNSYLSYYFFRKLRGKVTFFNSHNLKNGLFRRNFLTWVRGKTFRPMKAIRYFRDERYGLSLEEWIALVIPLCGESMQDISGNLKVPVHSLYRMRARALKRLGMASYREFCEMYITGMVRVENGHQRNKRMFPRLVF